MTVCQVINLIKSYPAENRQENKPYYMGSWRSNKTTKILQFYSFKKASPFQSQKSGSYGTLLFFLFTKRPIVSEKQSPVSSLCGPSGWLQGHGGKKSLIILRTPSSDQWIWNRKLKEHRNIGPYFSGTSKQNNTKSMKIHWASPTKSKTLCQVLCSIQKYKCQNQWYK